MTDRERRRRVADVESVLRAAITAADPAPAVKPAVARNAGLASGRRVHVVAIGKAAVRMYEGAREALRSAPTSALVVTPRGGIPHGTLGARLITGSHPIPDASSYRAGRAVAVTLRAVERDDVVLVLLSGGASSVCVLPVPGVSLDAYADTVRSLLHAGADIHEINTVRRQIDELKGGGMAALAAPTQIVGLVVSDVPGDRVSSIASGPLSRSPTDAAEAQRVLDKYGIGTDVLRHARRAVIPEDTFDRVSVQIVLRNADAVHGAARSAEQLGYRVVLLDGLVTGEARNVAEDLMVRIAEEDRNAEVPTCVIAGGETTVTVRGAGRGGRNQELVLAASLLLAPDARIVIGSVGTDGIDGSTNAAGAIADATTVPRGLASGLSAADALRQNDSGVFFENVGGAIRTGATGTNVMDVIVAACGPPR